MTISAENPFKFVEVAGMRLRYIIQGEGQPVVLVHGSGASLYTWRNNISVLAKHYKVVALDLPGFGFSDKPDIEYTPRVFADALAGFLDQLHLAPAHLIGSSLGASVCAVVALDDPDKVASLTLIDPRVYPTRPASWLNRVLAVPLMGHALLGMFNNRTMTAVNLREYYHDKTQVDNSLIDHMYEPLTTKGSAWSLHSVMRNCDYSKIFAARAGGIRQPTLIIWGRYDHLFPCSDGERLADDMHGTRLEIIEDAGHLPHEEKADVVNALLLDFLHSSAKPAAASVS